MPSDLSRQESKVGKKNAIEEKEKVWGNGTSKVNDPINPFPPQTLENVPLEARYLVTSQILKIQ